MVKIDVDNAAIEKFYSETGKNINDAANATVKGMCEEIQQMAKQFAPVKTGKLRNSIKVKVKDNSGEVYSDVPYAGYVENGTAFMKAHPFMKPARDAVAKNMKSTFLKELNK